MIDLSLFVVLSVFEYLDAPIVLFFAIWIIVLLIDSGLIFQIFLLAFFIVCILLLVFIC